MEKAEQPVVEEKINLEEEFKKLQQQVIELASNTKIKDELLEKAAQEKKQLEESYKMLSDTHQLLKDNMAPEKVAESEMIDYFKNANITEEEMAEIDSNILKTIYNTRYKK